MRQLSLLILLFSFGVFPCAVDAEVTKCDGVWTDKPCTGKVEKPSEGGGFIKMKPLPKREPPAASEKPEGGAESAKPSEPLQPRYELARKLRKISDSYKQEKGVFLSNEELNGFKQLCLSRETSYADCLKSFNEQSNHLIELNQKDKQNKIEAERNVIEAEKVRRLGNLGRTVIVRPSHDRDHEHEHEPKTPAPTPYVPPF